MRRNTSSDRLARQSLELSWAAPQVVAHRLWRMWNAGPMPSARDRREFALMSSEKVIAFQQAWIAMWMQAWMSPVRLAQSWWFATAALPSSIARPGHSLLHALSRQPASVLGAGLAPIHRKAVANAKRLSRRG